MNRRIVALYRSPTYSPAQHRCNDVAVMDATVERLEALGWTVERATERMVIDGNLPNGSAYLNMCQGRHASETLLTRTGGALAINHPSSVLNCHRHRLVRLIRRAGLPFPETIVVPTLHRGLPPSISRLDGNGRPIWVKRGDVHAERLEDVVAVHADGLAAAVQGFAMRGVAAVALQAHVPGPVVKFYGVTDERFFRWYWAESEKSATAPAVNEARLRELAFAAARALGLEVFGGDVAFPAPDQPILIDINDWPSFAAFRDEAADAIARYVHDSAGGNG